VSAPDPGSFRDPTSRVFLDGDRVLRGLDARALADVEALLASPFWAAAAAEGRVVGTRLLDPGSHPLQERWAGVAEHDRIPLVSYPYEWCFEMLRDAALAHLAITRDAVAAGFSTKDASAFNLTFDGTVPRFLDVGSFERPPRDEAWPGYAQFSDLFLAPLVLQAVGGVDFQPWLRGSVGGIDIGELSSLLPRRRRLRRGLGVHVTMQARARRKALAADAAGRPGGRGGFSPTLVTAQLANLERTVRRLRWRAQGSVWSDYGDRSHYVGDDLAAKEGFVADAVRLLEPPTVLDLGANDGRFSLLAVEAGARRAVATDFDHVVVDRLYRTLRERGEERVLPLVIDLMNPPAGAGWRGRERRPFLERARPDLTLCLAVVHHLAITDTVPFEEIVAMFADLGAPLVVEFPHPDDPMVERLLARKRPGLFDHYRLDAFEAALGARFSVERRLELGTRTLLLARPA